MKRRAFAGSAAAAALLAAAPAAPRRGPRVVSLDWGLAETALALGLVPVGLPDPADYRSWVVEPSLPEGVPDLGSRVQPNLERLATLRPDLILAAGDQGLLLPALRRLAPTLFLPIYAPDRDPWARSVAAARQLGEAAGREAEAEALVAAAEADMEAARARLAVRDVPPLLLASFADARHLRLYGAGSILQSGLDRMGLRNAWAGPTGTWGSATVGIDQLLPLRDAFLLTFDPAPPGLAETLDRSPLWRALPFVAAGRVASLPPVLMFGTLPAARRLARVLVPALLRA